MKALYKFVEENQENYFLGKENSLNARMIVNRKSYELLLLIVFMLCFKLSNGQIKTNSVEVVSPSNPATTGQISAISSILPPSPESASLGKYGNVPVNYYSGLPSIGVPLYTIKDKALTVDVNLSYHASGVKVDEIASSVGMSWVLNAGGVITRSTKGIPDEKPYGFRSTQMQTLWTKYKNNQMTSAEKASFEIGISNGIYDMQPDEFYYNFLGNSGLLLFRQDGTAFLTEHSNLKVEMVNGSSTSDKNFLLTDENGTKYYFEEKETIKPNKLCNNGMPATLDASVSAWYITKIQSHEGNQITFNYVKKAYTYFQGVYESFNYIYDVVPNCTATSGASRSVCKTSITTTVPYISSINFTNGNVQFIYELRPDTGGNRLSTVNVTNSINQTIKSFVFHYTNSVMEDRFFLSSIKEGVVDSGDELFYGFEYYLPHSLPARNSVQQDYWGYANGNTSDFLMPQLPIANPERYEWANRNPDAEKVKYGLLTLMSYPTGGSTKFEYEINQYGYTRGNVNSPVKNLNGGGVRIKSITDMLDDVTVASKRKFEYSNPTESDRSSGTISTFFANYYTMKVSKGCNGIWGAYDYSILVGNSNSMDVLGSTQGPVIGYKYVTEIIDNGENIGRIQHTFTSLRDYGDNGLGSFQSPPFVLLTSKEKFRGKLKQSIYFDKNSNKVKEELYEYELKQLSFLRGFKAMIVNDSSIETQSEIDKSEYEYLSLWSNLKEKKVILY
ncbi:hypothetical protein [Arcicella lustrica]|uniref:YD repeat-containing protein n=1 Tax=Arcicella lustrica TaxID=2984196 RepID=A0ABU5SPA5_9BACT|nr:hypothetical protein [Arcicella sp. DC25W]MEA5429121.1 hypothetical protein [Arcicella sp. DC25W]